MVWLRHFPRPLHSTRLPSSPNHPHMYTKNYCNLETRRHKENKYYSPGAIHSLVFPKADKETYLALQYQIQIRFDSSCEIMGSRIEDLATTRFAFMEIELGQTFSGPGMAFVYNNTSRGGGGGELDWISWRWSSSPSTRCLPIVHW